MQVHKPMPNYLRSSEIPQYSSPSRIMDEYKRLVVSDYSNINKEIMINPDLKKTLDNFVSNCINH